MFIDDVLYDLTPLTGQEAAQYPTQQSWAQAQLSFVAAVGQALQAHGYYVLVNASGYVPGAAASDDGNNTIQWWRKLGPYVNGLMNEYYQHDLRRVQHRCGRPEPAWNQNWDGWQQLVSTAQSLGKDFYGVTYGNAGDTAAMAYGKASFLLDWDGGGGAFMFQTLDGSDPSNPAWTTDIGQPSAAKQQVGVGWMRTYSGGIALVNPSPSTAQTFQLPGSYQTSGGSTVTSSNT